MANIVKSKREVERFRRFVENAYLNLGNVNDLDVSNNPLTNWSSIDYDDPVRKVLSIMRRPEYFWLTCKHILNVDLLPFQAVLLWELWHRPFPLVLATRGGSKTWTLGIYAILRALLCQGSRVIFCGASFRQSKLLFEVCERVYHDSPVLKDLIHSHDPNDRRAGPKRDIDRVSMVIGRSTIIGIPIGTGETVRGLRGTHLVCDEFSSHIREVYEVVLSGFAAVKASPAEGVKDAARRRLMQTLGEIPEGFEEDYSSTNQSVLAGTADEDYGHFADYWRTYKQIIESRGDPKRMEEIYKGEVPAGVNWKDFSIFRLPFELVPEGFMDTKIVARAKATMDCGTYACEYGATFSHDTAGYFTRRLIHSCVVGNSKSPIIIPGSGEVDFIPAVRGTPGYEYVYGVDPAAERNNFAIVLIELHKEHRRIVYVWTTNRNAHKERLRLGLTSEHDYFRFCARKLRDLMKVFPCRQIALDSQGGGLGILEALGDPDKLKNGELPIFPIINPDKEQDTDNLVGLHILEMVNFARAEWVVEANTGMKKDFEDKVLLFPKFDPLSLELAAKDDRDSGRVKMIGDEVVSLYDTLEEVTEQIELLKQELITIVHTKTDIAGREHWDTPAIRASGGKKGRLNKDRYSALIMCNATARSLQRTIAPPPYQSVGGFADRMGAPGERKDGYGQLYTGPEWYTQGVNNKGFGAVVRR